MQFYQCNTIVLRVRCYHVDKYYHILCRRRGN